MQPGLPPRTDNTKKVRSWTRHLFFIALCLSVPIITKDAKFTASSQNKIMYRTETGIPHLRLL